MDQTCKHSLPCTEDFVNAEIKANGVLVVDGQVTMLSVQKKTKNASGTSSSTTTQDFRLTGGECMVSR